MTKLLNNNKKVIVGFNQRYQTKNFSLGFVFHFKFLISFTLEILFSPQSSINI